MEYVKINYHQFEKQDPTLASKKWYPYDTFKCKCCGLEGRSFPFSTNIEVVKNIESCSYYKEQKKKRKDTISKIKKVKITNNSLCYLFGLIPEKVYDRVEYSELHEENFEEDVWIYNDKIKEHIRLFDEDYEIVE
jgi:hypothetical protein